LALTAALAIAGCASTTSAHDPSPSADTKTEVWPTAGADLANSRVAHTAIDASTIGRIKQVWSAGVSGALTTTPLILRDSVVVEDGSGRISSFDRTTGKRRWQSAATGFNIGPFGVAAADGRIFGVDGSSGVIAVDQATGHTLWTTRVTTTATTGVDIQPVVVDGLVLVSSVPVSIHGIYTGGDRGIISALEAKTGRIRWRFDTVDSADVWGNPRVNSGGGSWYPPAVDLARHTAYFGVANPAPFPGTKQYPNGSSRPGPNLYTDSVVALDLATGHLRWYHQVHPHDLFDRDLVHTMLYQPAGGRPMVVATGKGGVEVGLDRDTGKELWRTPVGVHHNDDLTALKGPTSVAPGTYGGVLTPPALADGTVYAAVINEPVTLPPDAPSYFGATLGKHDGEVDAVDATTGRLRWRTAVPGDPLGAATVAGDLVLTTLFDGTVVGLDRTSGKIVWTHKLPGGTNGWMALAGDLLVVPVGSASPPRLVAYRLG
jgi:outer membrane protein assembly factor BamB